MVSTWRDRYNKSRNQSPAEQFTDSDDGQLNASDRYDEVLNKFDTNRNGVFDRDEVICIIDEYDETVQANKALVDTNSNQRKVIVGFFFLIVLLSISNLGTGLLAANMSKEVVVVDGKIMANGGSQEEAISTMTSVRTLKKVYPGDPHLVARHRRMFEGNVFSQMEAGNETTVVQDNDDTNDHVCYTGQDVDALVESAIDGSGYIILLEGRTANNSTISRTVIPINGEVHTEGETVMFSNVKFVPVNEDQCAGSRETRRNLKETRRNLKETRRNLDHRLPKGSRSLKTSKAPKFSKQSRGPKKFKAESN